MRVVISIPAYNEAKTLGNVLGEIKKVMKGSKYKYKIVVVNDGSKDKTAAIAKEQGAIVFSHPKNYGLAQTFRTEMRECLKLNPDVIVHTDADGQYLANEIPKLIRKVEEGYDLVLGSRFKGNIESMPLIKRFGNRAFSKVISNITKRRISDGQTGFRAFTKEVANIELTSTFTYTQEQVIRAVKEKFRIIEVPVFFAKRGGKTKSRLMKGPFDYAIKAGINLIRIYRDYEPLKFFCSIGSIFFGVGFAIGLWLVYLFITRGIIGKLPSLMLSVLLMSIGVQIFLFGFLADIFRKN
jgi:glycosyltransferase involved in cell wall biosynthesis